jgi:hypothetical protein
MFSQVIWFCKALVLYGTATIRRGDYSSQFSCTMLLLKITLMQPEN